MTRNQGSNGLSDDNSSLKLTVALRGKVGETPSTFDADKTRLRSEINRIQEDLPWETLDRCVEALTKFGGDVGKATEWLLTTASEDNIKKLEVQLVSAGERTVMYRTKATQTWYVIYHARIA